MEVNPNPPNEGDTATERRGWGERARLSGLHPSRTVSRERPQSPLGILKAVCNRRAGRDGGIGRRRGHSQTGLARVCGDVRLAGGSVAEGCRQAGDGIACGRARARLNFSAQGQRSGRCRVNRRAERMSRQGQGEEPPPEGLGGHQLLAQTDARRPACQVMRHHLDWTLCIV